MQLDLFWDNKELAQQHVELNYTIFICYLANNLIAIKKLHLAEMVIVFKSFQNCTVFIVKLYLVIVHD